MPAALRLAVCLLAAWLPGAAAHAQAYVIDGDGIAASLTGDSGDAQRGRAVVTSRSTGLCLLCHNGPFPEELSMGNLATDLHGVGSRWTEAQLRLRVADARYLNPQSLMPRFHPARPVDDHQHRVGEPWRGQPVLSAQQVEDVVAFLRTLK